MPFEIESKGDTTLRLVDTDNPKKVLTLDKRTVTPSVWERASKLKEKTATEAPERAKKDAVPSQVFQNLLPSLAAQQQQMIAPAAEQNVMPAIDVQTAPQTQVPLAPLQTPMIQATTTQRQETKMGAEQKKAFEAYSAAQQEVAKTATAEAKLEIEKQKEIGIATEGLVQRNIEDWATVEAKRIKREESIKTKQQEVQTAMKELENFQFKGFFEGRSGARALAGISVALGSVGAAFAKGPNYALDIINKAIDDDLALQKVNYEKTKGRVEGEKSLLSQMIAKGMDEFTADKAAYAVRLQQADKQIDAMKAQVTNAESVARLDALQARLREQIAAKQVEATKGLDVKVITETKPMVVPTTEERAKSYTAFQEAVAKTPSVKEALDSEAGLREWKSGSKSAVDVARFIAGPYGLGQGSYGPTFDKMLTDSGVVDRSVEGLTKYLTGGQAPTLLKNIENFLSVRAVESAARAKDYLRPLEDLAERNALPRDILRKQMNPMGLAREQAKSLGLRPVGGK